MTSEAERVMYTSAVQLTCDDLLEAERVVYTSAVHCAVDM